MAATVTRILVPTDFSTPSNAALDFAKTLAIRFSASLHVLHVLEDPYVTGAFADVYAPPPAGLRESWLRSARVPCPPASAPRKRCGDCCAAPG